MNRTPRCYDFTPQRLWDKNRRHENLFALGAGSGLGNGVYSSGSVVDTALDCFWGTCMVGWPQVSKLRTVTFQVLGESNPSVK